MTRTRTFPEVWQVPLLGRALVTPICSGPHVLVADQAVLRALLRHDGTSAWSITVGSEIDMLVAIDGGCILSVAEPAGHRVLMVSHGGEVVWELASRWNVARAGLAARADRFVLAGAPRTSPTTSGVWEMRVADGAALRSVVAFPKEGPIATSDGWAWVDDAGGEPCLRLLDSHGDHVLAKGDFRALASAGSLILADGGDTVRAYEATRGLAWERPGGASRTLAGDAGGVVCGYRDGDATWVRCYDLGGGEVWAAGPFPSSLPVLQFWGDTVIASGVRWGNQRGMVVLDRQDGRILTRETRSWSSISGGVAADGEAAYPVTLAPHVTRREQRSWERIEDAWDPAYLVAVAEQLDWWIGGLQHRLDKANTGASLARMKELLHSLTSAGAKLAPFVYDVVLPSTVPDLGELRSAVAAIRAAGQQTFDRFDAPDSWLACSLEWPLKRTELPDDVPGRRVEMVDVENLRDHPLWQRRDRIATYAHLRYLSMRLMGLDGGPIGIELASLPLLEYLVLAENVLETVPPEVRDCHGLKYLDLRKNHLHSINPSALPPSLQRLELGSNPMSKPAIERLRSALPNCRIIAY